MSISTNPGPDSIADYTTIIVALDLYSQNHDLSNDERARAKLICAWYRGRLEGLLTEVKLHGK